MKKKRTPAPLAGQTVEPVPEPPVTFTEVRRTRRQATRCVICGNDVAPFSNEELCWVCRRLKISAWRDSDNQPSIQE